MEYNSLIQSVLRTMPSEPFVLATYMNDASKELYQYVSANKATTVYPMILLNKNYKDTEPQDNCSLVWLQDVSIYIIVSTDNTITYEQREADVFETILFPLKEELIKTMQRSFKFNFTNKGNNTMVLHDCTRMPYILSENVSQNKLNDVVDCLEVKFNYLKILK